MHKAGRIRVLATSDAQRSPFLPDVPTFKEAGYDIEGSGWYGVFAPAKTPADVVERLNKAIVAAVQSPEVKERLLGFGLRADRHLGRRARPHPEGGLRALGAGREGVGLHAGAVAETARAPRHGTGDKGAFYPCVPAEAGTQHHRHRMLCSGFPPSRERTEREDVLQLIRIGAAVAARRLPLIGITTTLVPTLTRL